MTDRLLRVGVVADRLGVCRRSVYGWIRRGVLEARYVGPAGVIRVPEGSVLSIIRIERPTKKKPCKVDETGRA
jgi:predicted site-specific integrase-resolvase